jgi:5'-3' exonuclease
LSNKPFDLNNMDDSLNTFFENVVDKFNIDIVDNEESVFLKIVSGDSSDNIKSIHQKVGASGKTMGIGDAGALKV